MTSSTRTLDDAVDQALDEAGHDDLILSLDPVARTSIARAWLEHAASERAEATSMAHVATIVLDHAGPGDLHWIAARATSDELRHAAICHRVARAYDPSVGPLPTARRFARFESTLAPSQWRALLVLAQCCVQETLAAAYLERAHSVAVAPLARLALRSLLADEIDHGRIGYAFAAHLTRAERQALRPALAVRVEECRALWHARAHALPKIAAPEHGVLDAETIIATIEEALATLVRGGLAALDL